MAVGRISWIDQRINSGVAVLWFLPGFGVWFFLAAADWRDGGSPPSWRRRASPGKRDDATHARICSRCDRARTRFLRSQNYLRSPTDGLRPPPAFRWMFPLDTRWGRRRDPRRRYGGDAATPPPKNLMCGCGL